MSETPKITPDPRLAAVLYRRMAEQGAQVSEADAHDALVWAVNPEAVAITFNTTLHREAVRLWNDRVKAMAEIREAEASEATAAPAQTDGELGTMVFRLQRELAEVTATSLSRRQRIVDQLEQIEQLLLDVEAGKRRFTNVSVALGAREFELAERRQAHDKTCRELDAARERIAELEDSIYNQEKAVQAHRSRADAAEFEVNRLQGAPVAAALAECRKKLTEHETALRVRCDEIAQLRSQIRLQFDQLFARGEELVQLRRASNVEPEELATLRRQAEELTALRAQLMNLGRVRS